MATAAEKRAWICEFAKTFDVKQANQIVETPGKDNTGSDLDKWLKRESASPHKDGLPWCASGVSAWAYWTDKHFNFKGPNRKFNSASSQSTGAGLFSKNYKDVVPGVAISWTNYGIDKKGKQRSGGHVGLVIGVTSTGIYTVEGNTSASTPQNRNGGASAKKFIKWSSVKNPATGRRFNAYYKIWAENNDDMKKELPAGDYIVDDSVNNIESNTSYESRSDNIRNSASSVNKDLIGSLETTGTLSSIITTNATNSSGKISRDKLGFKY